MLFRAQIKQKNLIIDKFKSNGFDKELTWGPKKLDIYMLSLRDVYEINNNNIISISAKFDYYKNDFSKSSTQNILRLGYVSTINKEWFFKIFGLQNYSYPTFMQTSFSPVIKVNPDLNPSKNKSLSTEITYLKDKKSLCIGIGRGESEDSIVFNKTQRKYFNTTSKSNFTRVYLSANYQFDLNNKIAIEYFKRFKKKYYSPGDGAIIQLFNKFGKFDIYNELIYRSGYTSADNIKMAAGYNYSLGIIYPINRKLQIKLKGENLLDKASEVPINGNDIAAIERRGLLTMEYTF
jgi:iron complex outermembrane receptor protein